MQPNKSENTFKTQELSPKKESINTNTYYPSSSQNNIIKKSNSPTNKSFKASNKSTSDRSGKTAKEERDLSATEKASASNKSKSKSPHYNKKHSHHRDHHSPYNDRHHSKRRDDSYRRHSHHGHSHSKRREDSSRYDSHRRYYDYDYDRHYRHHHYDDYYYDKDRSRSRSRRHRSKEKKKDAKDFMEERRRVRESSRSNSALRAMKMRNIENTCGFYQRTYKRPHEDNDSNKPQLYWDGYQWVIRPSNGNMGQELIKPDRKVQIANVPVHLNLQVNLFKDFILKNMIDKNVISTSDTKNLESTIKTIEFNKQNNTAILTMESIELAKQMILMDGIVLLGHTLRVSPYQSNNGEISLSNINKEAAYANSAQLSAKSAAISLAAYQSIIKNKEDINFNYSTGENKVIIPTSRIVKIMNAIDQNCKDEFKFKEVLEDMKDELENFGAILTSFIVKPNDKVILGAEIGSVFIEYANVHDSEVCISKMKGRLYDQREIKFAFFDESSFMNDILPYFQHK